MIRFFAGLMALLLSFSVQADPIKDGVLMELSFIKRVFETGYAPMQWKNEHFGFDLQVEYAKSVAELNAKSTVTARDYRTIVGKFLRSTRDYHVGISFVGTEAATLPFLVNGVGGRYFVVWIEQEKVSATSFPIQVGDELVNFGGRPVADVVSELKAEATGGEETTDWRLAERFLTKRYAMMGLNVPQGTIDLEFKRGADTVIKRQMAWTYTPEQVEWQPGLGHFLPMAQQGQLPSLLNPQMSWGMWSSWEQAEKADKVAVNPYQIGGRESYVPQLGTILWESAPTDIFRAYIFRQASGKLVGYVRMPHYVGREAGFKEFKEIVRRFEAGTDGMIIDQINNPGGSVFYVLALMSVLSKEPIKVPDHHIALWPAMMAETADLKAKLDPVRNDADAVTAFGVDNIDGFPINFQFAQSALDFTRRVQAEWSAGNRLTTPLHLWGADKVNPDPEVNYSKPLLVLTNELDFSGGDFFPAILQDNQRAKIFGQRTAGAGGYVLGVDFPSAMGMNGFSFTGSLARRVGNQPIENLGVTPDLPYVMTVNDLTNGYVDYKAAINKAIADMIP